MDKPTPLDLARLRGLTQRRLSRRDAFRLSGLGASAFALAACSVGGAGPISTTTPAVDVVKRFWAGKTRHGHVDFANWPLYMDTKNKPELTKFTAQTGI